MTLSLYCAAMMAIASIVKVDDEIITGKVGSTNRSVVFHTPGLGPRVQASSSSTMNKSIHEIVEFPIEELVAIARRA
jgi:hypothetical protein